MCFITARKSGHDKYLSRAQKTVKIYEPSEVRWFEERRNCEERRCCSRLSSAKHRSGQNWQLNCENYLHAIRRNDRAPQLTAKLSSEMRAKAHKKRYNKRTTRTNTLADWLTSWLAAPLSLECKYWPGPNKLWPRQPLRRRSSSSSRSPSKAAELIHKCIS